MGSDEPTTNSRAAVAKNIVKEVLLRSERLSTGKKKLEKLKIVDSNNGSTIFHR